jgi:LPXTG-motif cell wall-anchored protein
LDDGDYKLEETTVPVGYNKMENIEFSITAEHDTQITSLNGKTESGEINLGTMQKAQADPATGSITADIVNQSGSTLPSTGGIGTTIFYIVGGLMVLGAGVVLVTRKRVSSGK